MPVALEYNRPTMVNSLHSQPAPFDKDSLLAFARQVLENEALAVSQLSEHLDEHFLAAHDLLLHCR